MEWRGGFYCVKLEKEKNTYQSVKSVKTDCVWGESVKRNASYIMYFFDASPVQLEKPTNLRVACGVILDYRGKEKGGYE